MIPKIIHYCWFGRNPLPTLAQKCIKSWKKYCPDYQIIEWNEDNYDLSSAPLYVRQAYEAKKWAFVTDYVRLQVVYENGGIYLDTDVELLKSPNALLQYEAYFGFETNQYVNTGLGFGAVIGLPLLKELMDDYSAISFIQPDGLLDLTPCPVRNSIGFEKYGFKMDGTLQTVNNVTLLPREYLNPLSMEKAERRKSKKTISVHWSCASWREESAKNRGTAIKLNQKIGGIAHFKKWFKKLFGTKLYESIKRKFGFMK